MVLAEAVVFWVVLALLFRRDVGAIAHCSFRGGWKLGTLVVGLFAAQALVVLYVPGQTILQIATLILSQVALLLLVVLNRHLPGAVLFALGIVLNITVMVANGGWMPITPEAYQVIHPGRVVTLGDRPPSSKGVILPQSETRLWILSDIVAVELPWRRTAVSIGDVLLIAGTGQFIFQATARRQAALPAHALVQDT
jgi:hypothetical protein